MQYLLNEEEMATIRAERLAVASKLPGGSIDKHLEALKNVCQTIACTFTSNLNSGPHGCIHVKDPRGPQWQTRYCSGCAVAGICPQTKEWSK